MAATGGAVRAQIDELVQWTDSTDAIAAATGLLRRAGLPADHDHVDDVLAEVVFRITRRLDRHGPLEARPGVVAYARTTMGTVVTDLLRGRRREQLVDPRRDLAAVSHAADHAADHAVEHDDAPAVDLDPAGAGLEDLLDELRALLHRAIGPGPAWATAAALTFATLTVDPDLPLAAGVPRPVDGGARQRASWAGLHYAGRTDCFEEAAGEAPSAVRNRRARALKALDATLATAYLALIDPADDRSDDALDGEAP